MILIIVESPTKAKTLSRFLGGDYRIEASMGHIRDLPASRLGIDLEHDFKPEYVVSREKEGRVKELQKIANSAQEIILATDPDREGEAISWHVANLLRVESGRSKVESRKSKLDKKTSILQSQNQASTVNPLSSIKRIVFHEITESAIKEALNHPRAIDMNLVDAQQARRILDRLVGYKLSPLLWKKIRRGLSAGRVQSVAVRLIVEREREIEAFKQVEYWEIAAKLGASSQQLGAREFEAKLFKIDDKTAEIKNKEQSDKIVAELEKAKYQVSNVTTKEVKRNPYPPFTTSTLQQAASNLFGWSAKRTMQLAQGLYELGMITYHRTDSTNLAAEAINLVRQFIDGQYGSQYLPSDPRLYKTKSKVAQEAHEAIRPTSIKGLADSGQGLDRDQLKLYELIWKRFVACQMTSAAYEQTSVDITTSGQQSAVSYLFRANGSKQLFDGWRRLYGQNETKVVSDEIKDKDEETVEGIQELPNLNKGDDLDLKELLPTQHFTEPLPRYTEASLIKILEEYGIGRPSTYAPIISTIQERQYIEKFDLPAGRQGKRFKPTVLGLAVNDFLMANFPNILDYQFTAGMENNLDEIANGEKKWIPLMQEFYGPFSEQLEKVSETAERVKVEVEETDELCPNDNAPLVVRIGKFGKFLACSNFPTCKFTKPYVERTDTKCPKCGGDVIIRKTRTKRSFFGCSNYPKCDFASWTKPKAVDAVKPLAEIPNETNS